MNAILADAETHMKKSISVLSKNYAAIRAGRANPAVLNKIKVDYYGVPTAINQLAAISVTEARIMTIQPWDISSCKSIEKAIETSDLGINPQSDGKVIRLIFPSLSEERRRELVKEINKMSEECKVSVRSIRREALDKLKAAKKNSEIAEDDFKKFEKDTQNLTDKYCKETEDVCENKKKEIMEI